MIGYETLGPFRVEVSLHAVQQPDAGVCHELRVHQNASLTSCRADGTAAPAGRGKAAISSRQGRRISGRELSRGGRPCGKPLHVFPFRLVQAEHPLHLRGVPDSPAPFPAEGESALFAASCFANQLLSLDRPGCVPRLHCRRVEWASHVHQQPPRGRQPLQGGGLRRQTSPHPDISVGLAAQEGGRCSATQQLKGWSFMHLALPQLAVIRERRSHKLPPSASHLLRSICSWAWQRH